MARPDLLIRPGENEYKPLLDRERTVADIKEHLTPWVRQIRDIANYGTNLIPRCIVSSERRLEDAILIAVLLRQAVAMLDGVEVLLSNGAVHAASLQMRGLFEASVYIDWILAGDSERKAAYYYVHNLRRLRLWASRAQVGSPEWQEFSSMMTDFGIRIEDHLREPTERIQEINGVLSQTRFADINRDFDECRKKKNDRAWYFPLGQPSFASICRASVGDLSMHFYTRGHRK